jgi:hypothetical protein
MTEGPQFSDIQPKDSRGLLNAATVVLSQGVGLDYGIIQQVTPLNAFRVGQQIWFNLQIGQVVPDLQSYITRVRLKPWWLCENIEFRAPGSPTWIDADQSAFSGGTVVNNRYCWMPSPKRLDITPYQTPPPDASPVRNSDSIFLDDLWTIEMDVPTNLNWQATLLVGQTELRRGISFFYPAHGMALGFTCEIAVGPDQQAIESVRTYIKWKTGATHSHSQEAID